MAFAGVDSVYKGTIAITKAYLGSTLVYEKESGFVVSGVVEYYVEEVETALNYVQDLGSTNWVHHVVTTDLHYTSHNARNSMNIVKCLMNTGLFDKHMLLGDITEVSDPTTFQDLLDDGLSDLNDCTLFTLGNHDWQATDGVRKISNTEYKDAIMTNVDVTWVDADNLHYYYDDTKHKIRYIGINCGSETTTEDQITSCIAELDSDWTFFILCHYATYDSDADGTVFEGTNPTRLTSGYILTDATCGGWICGHNHIDYIRSDDREIFFPQATLDCDTKKLTDTGGDHNPGWASNPRIAGTTSEHAITIMSINVVTSEVKFYRIGAYQDKFGKNFGYTYKRRGTGDGIIKRYYPNSTNNYGAGSIVSWNGWLKMEKQPIADTVGTDGINMTFTIDDELLTAGARFFIKLHATPYSDGANVRVEANALNAKLAPNVYQFNNNSASVKSAGAGGLAYLGGYSTVFDPEKLDITPVEPADFVYHCTDDFSTCQWHDNYYVNDHGGYNASTTETTMQSSTSAIKVKPNTAYTLYSLDPAVNSSWFRIADYKANCTFISQRKGTSLPYNFTTTDGCEFISIGGDNLQNAKGQLCLVETASLPTSYTVTNKLSNVTSSNTTASVEENSAYTATLTAASGYTLEGATVTVTMDGTDVTATVYADGVISIPAVTGNVVITATAVSTESGGEEGGGEEGGGESGGGESDGSMVWKSGQLNVSGEIVTDYQEGMYCENYISVTAGDTIYFYNTDKTWRSSSARVLGYDANKNFVGEVSVVNKMRYNSQNWAYFVYTIPDGVAYIRAFSRNLESYYGTACVSHEAPVYAFEDVTWNAGYLTTSGGVVTNVTNGEMFTTVISVEPGSVYRFGNSNPDWTTDWNRAHSYTKELAYKGNIQATNGSALDYTIPEDVYYLAVSARNLADFYTTATFVKVS